MRTIRIVLLISCVPFLLANVSLMYAREKIPTSKSRLIILADMGNEPDEEQQMVHMLIHCNEFELEGLIAVTGIFLNEKYSDSRPFKQVLHPELFHRLIDGYAQVVDNLKLHAEGWPSPIYLHSITVPGQTRYGIDDVGKGKSSSGSQIIVKALRRDDTRPLHVAVNAGSNTLAQALWDIRNLYPPAEVKAMVAKLHVFENGAQDNAGAWICHEFPDIHWVRSNYQTYCYMGPDKDHGPYVWQPHPNTNQGMHRWAEEHIMRNHGALGELYPYRFKGNGFLEGGGTIPWLGLVNKGLYSTEETSWGGWSGRFSAVKQKNIWSRHKDIKADEARNTDFYVYTEVSDNWTDPETGTHYNNNYVPVWRWRRAMLNNCKARFDWCVKPYNEANHHPKAAFNGDTSDTIVRLMAKPGEIVALDATTSKDPDGDALDFLWWIYPEAGMYAGDVYIAEPHHAKTAVTIPSDVAGKQIHVILQVSDKNPIASLFDYRRVVIDVED